MILNDFRQDIKSLLKKRKMKSKDLADSLGVTPANVSKVFYTNIINPLFLRIVDALGYDVELKYIPQKKPKPEQAEAEQNK